MRWRGLTHEKLVEEARLILNNLLRTDVFGDPVKVEEAHRVIEPSLSLGFADFIGFLGKYGYVRLDAETRTVSVTQGGRGVLEGEDGEFRARLARHFSRQLSAAAGRPQSEPTSRPASAIGEARSGLSRRGLGPEPILVDEVIDRRYRRGPRLGRGAVGGVYRATHLGLGRTVALKEASSVFQYGYLRREEVVERMRRAVESQARMSHPHIVQILDHNPDREHPYVVMELAEGGNLRQRIEAAGGQLEPRVAVRALLQAAHALHESHRQDVLHLGLKPENLLFDRQGNVKLGDFGMVRLLDHEEGTSPTSVIVGTNAVGYFAPERLQPGPPPVLGPAADIYSLGILFYEMISGRLPGRRSPLPSKAREGIAEGFDEVFDLMTRDDLDERYGSMEQVLEGIYAAFGNELVFERGAMLAWSEDPGPKPIIEVEEHPSPLEEAAPISDGALPLESASFVEPEPLAAEDFETIEGAIEGAFDDGEIEDADGDEPLVVQPVDGGLETRDIAADLPSFHSPAPTRRSPPPPPPPGPDN